MSFDPTEWAKQQPEQQPASQPAYGQFPPQPNTPPAYGQAPQQPSYGQSNPSLPPYGQAPQQPTPQTYGQAQQPVYGQSSPSLPPVQQYGQGTPSSPGYPAYGQPADPYAAPTSTPAQPYQQGPQSWGAGMPPAYTPPAPAPQKKRSGAKIAIIIVVVLLLLGGGGGGFYAYYLAHLPKPVISMTSDYKNGAALVGATATKFQLTGHDFTASSTITFLLDGAPAPGSTPAQSASDGSVTTTLAVTDGWTPGPHTITAKDAAGYATKAGVSITVVVQGQNGTPGPNGAPTDSASGTVNATIQSGGQSAALDLTVTGSPDGGKVCSSKADGKAHSHTGTANGVGYTETQVLTCSGTYKGGKLSYTETMTSDKINFANGIKCVAQTPFVYAHLEGTFSSATAVSGSFSQDAVSVTCSLGGTSRTSSSPAQTGTWNGDASMQ